MVRFELRGELRGIDVGRMRWHISRPGSPLALCSRVVEPADSTLSLATAGTIPEDTRCPLCWAAATGKLQLPERGGRESGPSSE